MVCVDGCDPMEFQKKPSLGTCMATKIFKTTIIGRLGWRRLGLSNTLLSLLCSCVCGWVWCHRGWAAAVRRKQPLSSGNFTNGGGPGGGGSSQATALQRELYERRWPRRSCLGRVWAVSGPCLGLSGPCLGLSGPCLGRSGFPLRLTHPNP